MLRRRKRYELNPLGIVIAIFIGAVVVVLGGSLPLAIAVGLGLIPGVLALLGIVIWVCERLDARSRRKRWERSR